MNTAEKMLLSEEFKGHKDTFKKYNLCLSDLDNLERNYSITMTAEFFKKLGRKHFPRKATSTETVEITARQYALYISSIEFFGDRVEKGYTYIGYVPTKLTCTSPNAETKMSRKFKFQHKHN